MAATVSDSSSAGRRVEVCKVPTKVSTDAFAPGGPSKDAAQGTLHKSASPVSEPGAVATGQRRNIKKRRFYHRINLLNFRPLNIWPVATALGSDTATPTRLFTFCAKPLMVGSE